MKKLKLSGHISMEVNIAKKIVEHVPRLLTLFMAVIKIPFAKNCFTDLSINANKIYTVGVLHYEDSDEDTEYFI